jgi:hypothetical protein
MLATAIRADEEIIVSIVPHLQVLFNVAFQAILFVKAGGLVDGFWQDEHRFFHDDVVKRLISHRLRVVFSPVRAAQSLKVRAC